ncbi:MAG: ribonucleotide reductase beta subunit family protein with ferritin-like domain, partial [Oceanospirillaceae bacterium]
QWLINHQNDVFELSKIQQLALANLIPLLLCGEQSAIHVFNTESSRMNQANETLSAINELEQQKAMLYLQQIEADERLHEQALQFILDKLPAASEQHKIKRVAQRFYASIAQQTNTVMQHFQVIAQLDTCVCLLMDAVAKSSIEQSALAELFRLIKKDEARHVNIAKKHSAMLLKNAIKTPIPIDLKIQQQLVNMLNTQLTALQNLQINSHILFKRILQTADTSRVIK